MEHTKVRRTSAAAVGLGAVGIVEPRSARRARPTLRVCERKLLLVGLDLAGLNGALLLVLSLHPRLSDTVYEARLEPIWFLVLSAAWIVVGLALDVYDLNRAANAARSMYTAGSAAILVCGIYLFVPFLTPRLASQRLYALLLPALASAGIAAWRATYAGALTHPALLQTALVIGAGRAGSALVREIAAIGADEANGHPMSGYRLLGLIDDDPAKQGRDIGGVRVLGTGQDLLRLVQLLHPDELVVAVSDPERVRDDLFQDILTCWEAGISVTTMFELYERLLTRVPVEYVGHRLHAVLPLSYPAGYRLYLVARRGVELAIAVVGCLAMLHLIPVVWLANRWLCPGDLFYRQERVGKGGRTFRIIKFRSMIMDAEKGCGAVWARRGDSRITPVGRVLRKARLDEIPQFWNVLKGDMSLIGPRPERPEFVERLAHEVPFYRVRHAVKPSITGWAQVRYGYGASTEDALTKLQYDLFYIKHQGFYLDLLIVLRSVQVVLGMRGQ